MAVALEESGKTELINVAQVDGRVYYSYRTIAGDVFSIVRPNFDTETEKELIQDSRTSQQSGHPRDHQQCTAPGQVKHHIGGNRIPHRCPERLSSVDQSGMKSVVLVIVSRQVYNAEYALSRSLKGLQTLTLSMGQQKISRALSY